MIGIFCFCVFMNYLYIVLFKELKFVFLSFIVFGFFLFLKVDEIFFLFFIYVDKVFKGMLYFVVIFFLVILFLMFLRVLYFFFKDLVVILCLRDFFFDIFK